MSTQSWNQKFCSVNSLAVWWGLDIEVLGKKNMKHVIISFYFKFLSDEFGLVEGMSPMWEQNSWFHP